MKISLLNAGKRYNREWIFRHFNYTFLPGTHYAITGANGSGKSTMLQVIAGATLHSEGEINYEHADTAYVIQDRNNNLKDLSTSRMPDPISPVTYPTITEPFKYFSFAAPYMELVEEMTASEFLSFHSRFKPLIAGIPEILNETGLIKGAAKQIRYFSSGMKQRLKLAQAFFSNTNVLLLDEPITNLDTEGIHLYHSLINKYGNSKLIIVSSNDEQEYNFCKEVIRMGDYK